MSQEIDQHQTALLAAFARVLKAEQAASKAKTELDEHTTRLKGQISDAHAEEVRAWSDIQALIAQTGEVEVVLPGAANDYRIHWSTPRESVQADVDAAPEEWVKVERKLKLKEIAEHLKQLRADGQPMPNWARFEKGQSSLCWKAVKKGTA